MANTEMAATPASLEEIQQAWPEIKLKVAELEAGRAALEQESKALRQLLERALEHRQKSHTELVLLLTELVSKLPMGDVGALVSRLVEHNTNVSQYLAALVKGTAEALIEQPAILKTLDQTKRDLLAALKPVVEELIHLEAPLETPALQALLSEPNLFFSPPMLRANRCFIKALLPRERIVREFGEEALVLFQDVTTDAKLNPRPKREEIVLAFKPDFEAILEQNPALLADKRPALVALYHRVQQSKFASDKARAQKSAFQKLSFLLELLHYYQHQSTVPSDVVFAQRLPVVLEQLVLAGAHDKLDETLLGVAEGLLAYIINPDHRHMVINNIGKGSAPGKTLRYVLTLRAEKVLDADHAIAEFIRHLLPSPAQKPSPENLAAVLRLITPEMQRRVVRAIMDSDRLRKSEAQALGKALGAALGLPNLDAAAGQANLPPEVERQTAWARIKDLILQRAEAAAIAAAIRDRLNARYDAEEIRQSWITLTEADPLSLIKVFCHLPYLVSGKTDPIARTVLESYVTRLTHEKYHATYKKVVNSLKNLATAKPDSPTLVNFLALVKWVDADAAARISNDIGLTAHTH